MAHGNHVIHQVDRMKNIAISAITLSLAACAIPTTGVVQLGDGLRKVTRSTNAGSFYNAEQLKLEAIKEATASCEKDGKKYRLVDITQRPPRPLGGWPEAVVLCRCE